MWLLDPATRERIEQAEKTFTPTAENMAAVAEAEANAQSLPTRSDSGEALIDIRGILTKRSSWYSMMFGGATATYSQIAQMIKAADSDPVYKSIRLTIDSPGGNFNGLFDAIDAIKAAKKPVYAYVDGMAASAAYAIAASADRIIATNKASIVGSVGVVASFWVSQSEITITNSDSPRKRPDVRTAEGKAMVVEELDAMADLFIDAIAEGRGVSAENVRENFGQGATLLATQALERGMIDEIVQTTKLETRTASMDLKQLKAEHPETYAAAVQDGVTAERDRVCAHLIMGEKSGAMETASAAIKDGSAMTATLQATYLTAGMNRADVSARQADESATGAAVTGAAATQIDPEAETMAILDGLMGVAVED